MILDNPSKLSEIATEKNKEKEYIIQAANREIKALITEIGLAGLLTLLAELCRKECQEIKTGDSTLNYIAFRLDVLGQEIASFRDIYKIVERKKEKQNAERENAS